jgi:hypothetical protein
MFSFAPFQSSIALISRGSLPQLPHLAGHACRFVWLALKFLPLRKYPVPAPKILHVLYYKLIMTISSGTWAKHPVQPGIKDRGRSSYDASG